MEFTNGSKLRDFRFLLKGRFPQLDKRDVTWSAGIMYNEATEKWVMRQSGVMVALPNSRDSIFVGRGKEGFSLNKVMVGYGRLDARTDPSATQRSRFSPTASSGSGTRRKAA